MGDTNKGSAGEGHKQGSVYMDVGGKNRVVREECLPFKEAQQQYLKRMLAASCIASHSSTTNCGY